MMPIISALDGATLDRFLRDLYPAIAGSIGSFRPEIGVASAALAIFLADLFLPARFSRHLAWVALAACVVPVLAVLALWNEAPRSLFLGMVAIDPFANFFKIFFLLGAVPIIILTYLSREFDGRRMGEYYGILLSAVLGAMLMASSNHLLMAFLSLELLGISSYVLVGYFKSDRRGSEASLKYIIYGSVAAGIMAYGLSLLYGVAGSGSFAALGGALRGIDAGMHLVVAAGLLLAFAGLAFKMAAIPMHFWCPDVYEGAPTAITAFLSVGSKAAGFALALRFLGAVDPGLASSIGWPAFAIVVSAFTMTLGNLAALWQDNLKRMLAYSSIAHAGYMCMGLAVLHGEEPWTGTGLVAYYLLAYLAMNLGAFAVVILVESRTGSVDIGSYAGLGRKAPFLAVALTLFLFSLIGIPPTAGFMGKLQLFSGVLAEGRTGGWPYYALTVIAVINTAISVYYYARIIKNMYLLEPATEGAADAAPAAPVRFPVLGTALVAVLLFLTFFLFFQLDLVARTTLHLRIFS